MCREVLLAVGIFLKSFLRGEMVRLDQGKVLEHFRKALCCIGCMVTEETAVGVVMRVSFSSKHSTFKWFQSFVSLPRWYDKVHCITTGALSDH